jgi:hypothetical protein
VYPKRDGRRGQVSHLSKSVDLISPTIETAEVLRKAKKAIFGPATAATLARGNVIGHSPRVQAARREETPVPELSFALLSSIVSGRTGRDSLLGHHRVARHPSIR